MAQHRKKKRKFKVNFSNFLTIFEIVLAIAIFFALFSFASAKLGITSVSDVVDSFSNFFRTLSPGEGYPYKINSSSVKDIEVLNGNIYVLLDDKTLTLDKTAKEVKISSLTYSTPAFAVKGGRAVVFNRNGNRYRIENRTDILHSGETNEEEKIITAALSRKGMLALATLCKDARSKLTVLNSSYKKEVFVWKCAQDSIVSVDLSSNGRYAAVAVVGARDGEMFSKVYTFDFKYAEPIAEFEYPKTAILSVRFSSNDNVVAIGDNLISFIKDLKKVENKNFGTSTLVNFTYSDRGDTILVLSEYGSTNSQILTAYSSSFNVNFEEKFDSNIKDIFAADGKVNVLLEDKVIVFRSGGTKYKEYSADTNSISVLNIGNKTYVYAIGKIVKCTESK
ncbi:MAG: hypothetical protein GX241_00965 [Ruminococcaceae bacterium]|nr:hypothetical protein [Oscillospiraceae bacterium]